MTAHPDSSRVTDGIWAIARRRQLAPTYIVQNEASRFYAAKWQLPAHQAKSDCHIGHILLCRVEGETPTFKTVGRRALRKNSYPGTITLIPNGEYAQYTVEGYSTFLELYLPPSVVKEFCEQHAGTTQGLSIRPLFADEDAWLAGYFQMLQSEIDLLRAQPQQLDALLLGQAQQLLLAHLFRRYSCLSPVQLQELTTSKAGYALRPHLMKRVIDFIDANLTREVRLSELAALVQISERHFIRAFNAATGRTPYQYVLEKRLHACAKLLRTDQTLSVAAIGASMGFKTASHFAAKFREHFKVTPSHYRRQAGHQTN